MMRNICHKTLLRGGFLGIGLCGALFAFYMKDSRESSRTFAGINFSQAASIIINLNHQSLR